MSKTISFKCDDWLYDQLKNQTNNTSKFIKEAIEEKLSVTKPKEESEIQKLWQEINNIKAEINSNTQGTTKSITGNTKVIPNKETGNTESKLSANQLRALEVVNSIEQSLNVMSSEDKKAVLLARYPKNEFRKRMKEVVSKDSVSKYWEKIEQGLKA